jgi:Ca-activated chloride channel homolog
MDLASRLVRVRGMRRGILLLISWLAVMPAFGQQTPPGQAPGTAEAQPPQGPAVFKAGIDLVSVTATVRDRRGRLVRGLNKDDFEVLDNGQPRRISDFRADASPVSLAILFDISGSMRVADRLLAARFAAHHVLSWLEQGRDEAALLTFDSRLH